MHKIKTWFSGDAKLVFVRWMGVLGVALAIWHISTRLAFDLAYRKVSVTIGWDDLVALGKAEGRKPDTLAYEWARQGLFQTLAISEDTLPKLRDDSRISWQDGAFIINDNRSNRGRQWVLLNMGDQRNVLPEAHYVIVDNFDLFERIKNRMILSFGPNRVSDLGFTILEVKAASTELETLGLGFSQGPFDVAQGAGVATVLRVRNNPRLKADDWGIILRRLKDFEPQPSVLLFDGDYVGGYPRELETVAHKMVKEKLTLGVIEFASQDGDHSLASGVLPRVLRVHSIPEDELALVMPEHWVNRYVRAARERNVRLLYVHPYLDPLVSDQLLNFNAQLLKNLRDRLWADGFKTVPVSDVPLSDYRSAGLLMRILLAGVLGALTMAFLTPWWPLTWTRLFSGMAVFWVLTLAFSIEKWAPYGAALMALYMACFIPVSGVVWALRQTAYDLNARGRLRRALQRLVALLAWAVLGGVWIGIWLANTAYLLSVQQFFGVKISFLLPVLCVAAILYMTPARWRSFKHILHRVSFTPLSKLQAAGALVFALFVLTYILRSSNTMQFELPWFESAMRQGLETWLGVRPRTKEFLIGIPLLWLVLNRSVKRRYEGWVWFLGALGTVAPVSVVNSFCHLHTPLLISLQRTLWGLVLGLLCGLLLDLCLRATGWFYKHIN